MLAHPQTRRAFSILELVAVLAMIVILGAAILPTLNGLKGDTHTKAGADTVQEFMARARSKAIEGGQAYRLAVSTDGKRLRLAPDTYEAMGEVASNDDNTDADAGPYIREDDLPAGVTATLLMDDGDFAAQDNSGWRRIATFQSDGTCREDNVELRIEEAKVMPILIRLRGLTGLSTITRGTGS